MMESCAQSNQRVWALALSVIERGIQRGLLRHDIRPEEMALLLWSNTNAIMMRIDYEAEYWQKNFRIDLNHMLQKSNSLILETVMSERAKSQYRQSLSAAQAG